MPELTAEILAERAHDVGLITDWELRQIWSELGRKSVSLDEFIQFLVRREYLTNYQVDKLLNGEREGFFYGPYKVLYLVGAGSFARVFRAVHKDDKTNVVALKVLRRRYSDNPQCYQQFIREGRLGMALKHPNIVPVYDVCSYDHTHFLVMEFVEGQNLREFVKVRKKLDPIVATRIMVDIMSGLDYAFRQGTTHRDLKLSNVLISSDGTAKLVDFGLAAVDEYLEATLPEVPANARAIDYAALEKATGVPRNDPRSDIYFAGCMYYHMLTGDPPLSETKDRMKRLSRSRFFEVVPIQERDPTIPKIVAGIINKAMSLDASARYQTPGDMLFDLKLAAKRLAQGDTDVDLVTAKKPNNEKTLATVLVVEPNVEMQNILREGLKKLGYRVLIISNPQRALERIKDENEEIDCVIINATELGEPAVTAFNQIGDDPRTHLIPAILLLDEPQRDMLAITNRADHRRVVSLPITMKQLRTAVSELVDRQRDLAKEG
ncbi:MAG: protein kinase [Thermogutta sp.]|uniref:protein kinase domain-containing protein n=1 Tax=Thermogutta sp. TaxID=1962930 RepID=UPI0019CDCAAC|nr:protein kinase [Thermogutta sp.]MBC7352005.1 protein kinase [Thermogutta sp.]